MHGKNNLGNIIESADENVKCNRYIMILCYFVFINKYIVTINNIRNPYNIPSTELFIQQVKNKIVIIILLKCSKVLFCTIFAYEK